MKEDISEAVCFSIWRKYWKVIRTEFSRLSTYLFQNKLNIGTCSVLAIDKSTVLQ